MAIPRFSSLLWEEAGRGLWIRCHDVKPGKVCFCRQVWSQLPLDQAGQLLSLKWDERCRLVPLPTSVFVTFGTIKKLECHFSQ